MANNREEEGSIRDVGEGDDGTQSPELVIEKSLLVDGEDGDPDGRVSGRLELVENITATEINPYGLKEYLDLLRQHTPHSLNYELRDKFEPIKGAIVFVDAQGFSGTTTRLAEEKGEKAAGEEIAMFLSEADEKLIGLSELYGGFVLQYEGDGRRVFFPSLEGEDDVEATKRAVFVAKEFQESTKSLPEVTMSDGPHEVKFRVGVDCTRGEQDRLLITSLGDNYLRTMAVFGEAVSRVDAVQRDADPDARQVSVSSAVKDHLVGSRFVATDSGNFILKSLRRDYIPEATDLPSTKDGEESIDLETLNHFYEAHIPESRRKELRNAVAVAMEEARPVEYKPTFDFARVSTVFMDASRLSDRLKGVDFTHNGVEYREKLNGLVTEALQIVHRNSGSVERIAGEGTIYATFEGPSNEYHAARAAHEVRSLLREEVPDFRAGISTDYAFSGIAGSEKKGSTFTQIGKRVNESARLMQTAPEGAIVISPSTNRRASHRLKCRQLDEPIELKGIGVVDRYVVEGVDYRAGRYAEVERIVGREGEQKEIEKMLVDTSATGSSRTAILEGEAGVGKTALATKVIADNLEKGKISKFDIRSDEAARKLPLSTASQLVRQLLEIPEELESPKDIEAKILSQDLPTVVRERLSLVNAILGTAFPDSERVRWLASSSDRRRETIAALRGMIEMRSSQSPDETPVVYLDDWQFIDRQSADLLVDLMGATKDDGIFWMVPTRPAANEIEGHIIDSLKKALPENSKTMAIKPFPAFEPPESAKNLRNAQIAWFEGNKNWAWPLMCSVFPIDASELQRNPLAAARITAKVFSKDVSHGNVFYVREVLSHLAMSPDEVGAQVFVQHPETQKWHFGDYALPGETAEMVRSSRKYYLDDEALEGIGSIEDIEYQKFNLLDSNSQRVLRAMAILGLETSKSMLEKITRMPKRRIDLCLDQLMDHGMVIDLDDDNFSFAHRITQETIYNRIAGIDEKQATHAAILDVLEEQFPSDEERLSAKFFHAKNSGNLMGILRYADLYGHQLKGLGEESGAISVLERGVQAFEELERNNFDGLDDKAKFETVNDQLDRLLSIRRIWHDIGNRQDEVDRTLDLAHNTFHVYYGDEQAIGDHPVEFAMFHAHIVSDLGLNKHRHDPEGAMIMYEDAIRALGSFANALENPSVLDHLGDREKAKILENLSDAYRRIGMYYRQKGDDESLRRALSFVDRSVKFARLLGDKNVLMSAINSAGIIFNRLSRLEDARSAYVECIDLAESRGDLRAKAMAMNNLALVSKNISIEHADEAQSMLEEALGITKRIFAPEIEARCQASLGTLYGSLGIYDKAIEHFGAAVEFFDGKNKFMSDHLQINLVHYSLMQPDPDTGMARSRLIEVDSTTGGIEISNTAEYLGAYVDYLDEYVSWDEVVSKMSQCEDSFDQNGMQRPLMSLYAFWGEVTCKHGDLEGGIALLNNARKLGEQLRASSDVSTISKKIDALSDSAS